ncbi:MAG: energy transducer TonB [Gemmatimonadota bacterium]
MPTGRILKYCLALSVLFHVAIAALATLIPAAPRRAEDVMVVDLADLPRSPDFLPPKPGIIRGRRPPVLPKPVRPAKPLPRPEVLRGRVPDRPVNPDLPPEKDFRTTEEPRPRPEEPPARTARAPDKPRPEQPAASAPPKGGAEGAAGGAHRSLRDLTPTLGKMVIARIESGAGRGQEASRGTAAGTDAKGRDKGEIAEEPGGGAHLTPLNAPEIQYISYFASIKRKIELVWQYPYDAQIAGIQGDLVINFVIGPSGRLESVVLVDGSGHRILDEEALRAIRAAAPFDPIPAQYKIPNLQIRGHFVYEMHTLKLR